MSMEPESRDILLVGKKYTLLQSKRQLIDCIHNAGVDAMVEVEVALKVRLG